MNGSLQPLESSASAKLVYILYLVAIFVGITGVIGVVVAYIYRSEAPDWLATHYRFQIRTFWIGLLYTLIGGLTAWLLVGWLILFFWLIWLIVRCVKGFRYLERREPYPEPDTWLF